MKWLLLIIPFGFVSCASQKVKPSAEPIADLRSSPSVWINGAELRSDVQPLKGVGALGQANLIFSAKTNKLDGPFYWEFVAVGTPGEQVSMTVEEVQISTQRTRRQVVLPREMLGAVNAFEFEVVAKPRFTFRKKPQPEEQQKPRWLASYKLPSLLQVFPKADGRVTVAAKIRIDSSEGSVSEWVNFALLPAELKSQSFSFRETMIEYDGVPID